MNQERIGKFIKKLRKEKQLTQKGLAESLGVTYQAVSKWENGKNIPDILILKKISEEFDCNLSELLNGEKEKRKTISRKMFAFISILSLLVLLLTILCIHLSTSFHSKNFEFKTLSSTCDTFRISGSIAYNKEQSSIYISHVEYCGEKEEEKYIKFTCTLYEKSGNILNKISETSFEGESTLDAYLKSVSFYVEDAKKVCKKYEEGSLYIEIETMDEEEKVKMYKIPLLLKNNYK